MKRILTGEEKREIDRYSIEVLGVPALMLMEEAALALAGCVRETVPEGSWVLAVCGSGNNGGDGIAAARILFGWGYEAEILMIGDLSHATAQVEAELSLAREAGVCICKEPEEFRREKALSEYDLLIDAVFGIGLTREVKGSYASWIEAMNESKVPVIAADIPSGIEASTGRVLGCAVRAAKTVTFGEMLLGLVRYPGAEYAGRVQAVDIGFPEEASARIPTTRITYEKSDLAKLPARRPYSNKGTYGRVLVMAGSKEISGAAYLAAKAAYRMGAGLVRILTHEANRTILGTLVPEALFSICTDDAKKDLPVIREAISWADVIVAGPGLGRGAWGQRLTAAALASEKPAVIDADGIRHLGNMDLGVPEQVILTPHLKEMADFLGTTVAEIAADPEGILRGLSEDCRGKIVLKDARTFVKDGQMVYINTSGNSGMATGGSGDVLAGMIGGLLAQKCEPGEAARLGVYLHGLAGDAAAARLSEYSLMAGDLIDALPEVLLEAETVCNEG